MAGDGRELGAYGYQRLVTVDKDGEVVVTSTSDPIPVTLAIAEGPGRPGGSLTALMDGAGQRSLLVRDKEARKLLEGILVSQEAILGELRKLNAGR